MRRFPVKGRAQSMMEMTETVALSMSKLFIEVPANSRCYSR